MTATVLEPSRTAGHAGPQRILVVVDQPCASHDLYEKIEAHAGDEPAEALVVVPEHGTAETHWYVDENAAHAEAAGRLRDYVHDLATSGVHAEGHLGDPDPVRAISDALYAFDADEIVLFTAAQRPSTWLHRNVVDRARHSFAQPIEHVVVAEN